MTVQPGGTGRLPERAAAGPDPQARVLTIPNALSVARLAGLPVFLWLATLGSNLTWIFTLYFTRRFFRNRPAEEADRDLQTAA